MEEQIVHCDQFAEAVEAIKKAGRLSVVMGGQISLAAGAIKMIDAFDSIAANNYTAAADDLWTAAATIYNILYKGVASAIGKGSVPVPNDIQKAIDDGRLKDAFNGLSEQLKIISAGTKYQETLEKLA